MKKSLKFIALNSIVLLTVFACSKLDLMVDVPEAIEEKIEQIKNVEVQNPPAEVWQWEVDGNTYYYFTSDCCDQLNFMYDEAANVVCAPDGGNDGLGDGNCPDFNGDIVKTLVWRDSRN